MSRRGATKSNLKKNEKKIKIHSWFVSALRDGKFTP